MANDIDKTSPHYKGDYDSIYEVNKKFPTGGVAGDFVVIEGWAHYWNADRATWCVNAQRDSYWDELITNIIEKFKLVRGATYMGVANLDSVPAKVIGAKMYYFATVAGTYKNFGDLVVPQGINVLYSENGSSWVNTTLLEVAQELGVSTNKVVSQKTLNEALAKKFDKESVVQESGEAEDKVMSQKAVSDKLSDLSIKQVETYDYPKLQYIGFLKGCYYDDNTKLSSFNDSNVEEGLLFYNVSNFTGKKISIQFREGLKEGYPILAFFNANNINSCNSDTILREFSIFTNINDYLGKEISIPQHAKILCVFTLNALGNAVSVIGQFGSYNLQPLTYINRYHGFIFNKSHEFKQAPNLGTFVYNVSGLKRIVVKSYIDDVNSVENAVQCGFSTMRDIEKTDFISSENVQIKTFYENTFDVPDGAKYFFITTKTYNEIPLYHNVIRIGTPVLDTDIVHEIGEAEDKVMSQKAVSDFFRTTEKKKYTINCWGDSLTDQNTWEPYLSQKLSANNINNIVNNYGIGGEATDFICCRIGTFPIYTDKELTINGNSTFDSVPFVFIDNNGQEQTYNIGNSNIRSDRGTSIFHLENDFTVNVSFSNGKLALSHIAGTTKKFPKGTIAYPDSIKHANVGDINIFFIGTNGFRNGDGCPKTKDIIANIIDSIKKSIRYCGSDKYLVIGIFSNDTRSISLRDYWDEEFRKTFGNKLIDFRKYVISNGLTDFGLTPTTEDNEAIALGNVPPQLQISDKFHLNDQGGKILAELIYKRIFALGYLN